MPTKATKTADGIQKAQAMRRKVGMSDADFVALKTRVTGKASLKGMTPAEIDAVIADLKRLYPDLAKPARRRDPAPAPGLAALWSKIDAQLHSMGLTRKYLDGEIKTKLGGGISSWHFANAAILHKVIAALAKQQQRTGAPTK